MIENSDAIGKVAEVLADTNQRLLELTVSNLTLAAMQNRSMVTTDLVYSTFMELKKKLKGIA